MNRLFLTTLVAFSLIACNSENNKNADSSVQNGTNQVKQLNISILLDLSDRISPQINPKAKDTDIENIKTITEFFKENMKQLNAYNAKGKIRVFLVPPPSNTEINSIVNKINIDCSKMDNKQRKSIYDSLTVMYTQYIEKIYNETISVSNWIGSDIWRFFKDDVKDYCIEDSKNYRNILIIFTDGYLYHEHSKYSSANRFSYLLNSNLSMYRNQNWKQLVEKNDFGIIAERDDLEQLEVLVLEVRAENSNNKIDEDILPFVFKKWFNEMNVSRFEVYRSDLPANTKTRIDRFLKSN